MFSSDGISSWIKLKVTFLAFNYFFQTIIFILFFCFHYNQSNFITLLVCYVTGQLYQHEKTHWRWQKKTSIASIWEKVNIFKSDLKRFPFVFTYANNIFCKHALDGETTLHGKLHLNGTMRQHMQSTQESCSIGCNSSQPYLKLSQPL